jgi:hypothetical protein
MSALIKVEDLSVELPIYGIHGRSLKKTLVNLARIIHEAGK